jgi:endonuclease YncB( thermonuclease family)
MRAIKFKPIAMAFCLTAMAVAISLALPETQTQASIARETMTGHVIGVSDGDSITVRAGEVNLKVRLAQIDAPETGQPWGSRSRQELQELVAGKEVMLTIMDQDRYGRSVAQIEADGIDVNRDMIARGAAWAYTAYLTDDSLRAVEADARARRAGLWAMPAGERVAPWDYRREKRKAREVATAR